MSSLLTMAQDGFAAAFGYSPDGLWSAPGRVNLIGEHTDYNEGFVLPFAIDRRTVAALALRGDGLVRVSSSTGPASEAAAAGEFGLRAGPGDVHGWAAYPLGIVWGLGQLGADLGGLPGFDVHFVHVVQGQPVQNGVQVDAAAVFAADGGTRRIRQVPRNRGIGGMEEDGGCRGIEHMGAGGNERQGRKQDRGEVDEAEHRFLRSPGLGNR